MSANHTLPGGYQLHWYEIKSILGQGGFGITYLAYDKNLEKNVAIKEYFPTDFARREQTSAVLPRTEERQPEYQWGLDRFIAEARTLSKFEHPNIVKVHAVFEENGTGYMVMSYESGRSLQSILDETTTLDEATLLAIVKPLLGGLALVHQHNFIHRDIKPDNIFIRQDGSPALLDFGSARQSLSGESTAMTILVTPGYAPVEQYYSKSDEQGPWTDIYGLGATLYRAITGKSLTNAVDRSKSMLNKSLDEYRQALDLEKANFSKAFLQAVDHAVQFNPEDRPQSVEEWAKEFPEAATIAATQLLPRQKLTSKKTRSIKQPLSNSKKGLYAATLVVVIIVAIGGYLLLQGQSISKPENIVAEVNSIQPATETKAVIKQEEIVQQTVTDQALANASRQQQAQVLAEQLEREEQQRLLVELKKQKEQQRLMLEQQRQLDEEKRQLALEKERIKEQAIRDELARKKLAEEQARAELIEKKIAVSRNDFAARYAAEQDNLGYREAVETTDLAALPTKQRVIPVYANIGEWQSSGLNIIRGQHYTIEAKGTWRMGAFCNPSTAKGEDIYTLLCQNLGNQIVANNSHGSLIGKIGQQSLAFYVGEQFSFTADQQGTLYFMPNEPASLSWDNSGNLDVTIKLSE